MIEGNTYFVKRLKVNDKLFPQETCKLLKLNDDGTCVVKNEDGEIRLFMQDMLSEKENEVYMELHNEQTN